MNDRQALYSEIAWGSEMVFLSIELDDRSSIILRFSFSYNVFCKSMYIKKACYLKIKKILTIKAYEPRNSFSNMFFVTFCRGR